jgi:hypothetical protein
VLLVYSVPLADVRSFLAAPGRVAPTWDVEPRDYDFVRHFGRMRERLRGRFLEWPTEAHYCDASSAVRFPADFSTWPGAIRQCAFRRVFSDGTATRIDIGIALRRHRATQSSAEVLSLIRRTLALPVRVYAAPRDIQLGKSDRALAQAYLQATTQSKQTPELWWVSAGRPLLIIEYEAGAELEQLPQHHTKVELSSDVTLAHARVEYAGRRYGVWFIGKGVNEDRDLLRRLRVGLTRNHAERETLKEVLRLLSAQRFKVERGNRDSQPTDPQQRFQRYVADAISRLEKRTRDGLPQKAFLSAAEDFEDVVGDQERQTLLELIKPWRPNLVHHIKEFIAPRDSATGTVYVLGDGPVSITQEQNGSKIVNDNSITNTGPVGGDLVQVIGAIDRSFNNRVTKSDAPDELKERLRELTEAVKQMIPQLPPKEREEQADNLDKLTAEALSPAPKRKWYELSAEGLKEAALALGDIAAPVLTAVQAVLTIIGKR